MKYELTLKGFNSQDEVDEFLGWYSNSGEQDFGYHLEHSDSDMEFVSTTNTAKYLNITVQNLEITYK